MDEKIIRNKFNKFVYDLADEMEKLDIKKFKNSCHFISVFCGENVLQGIVYRLTCKEKLKNSKKLQDFFRKKCDFLNYFFYFAFRLRVAELEQVPADRLEHKISEIDLMIQVNENVLTLELEKYYKIKEKVLEKV